jgi:hypothetical protein
MVIWDEVERLDCAADELHRLRERRRIKSRSSPVAPIAARPEASRLITRQPVSSRDREIGDTPREES